MKIFYINLDKDADRRDHMEKQLTFLGFEYERFPAVDGRNPEIEIEIDYDEKIALKKNRATLTPGELGCAMSHRALYEKMVKEDIDYMLIMEDDVKLPDNFSKIVETEISKNTNNKRWEYLSFDYAEMGNIFLRRWAASVKLYYSRNISTKYWYQNIYKKLLFFTFVFLKFLYIAPLTYLEQLRNKYYESKKEGASVIFLRPLYFAGCYLITRSGAQKILALSYPIVYPADRVQNQARLKKGLKCRAYSPLCVAQLRRKYGSSIIGLASIEY